MKRYLIPSLILMIIISIGLISGVAADREPNNTIENSECIDEGYYRGTVSAGDRNDVDYYRLDVSEGDEVRLSLLVEDNSNLKINVYESPSESDEVYSQILMGSRQTAQFEYINEFEDKDLYILIRGDGNYQMRLMREKVSTSEDQLIPAPGIFALIFFIALILLIVIIALAGFKKIIRISKDHPEFINDRKNDDIIGVEEDNQNSSRDEKVCIS